MKKQVEIINKLIQDNKVDTNLISDGYHTFGELYAHRIELFIALCRELENNPTYQTYNRVWRSKLNAEGSGDKDWFIMGIELFDRKIISYHLPISKWNETDFVSSTYERVIYDGHNSNDTLERLKLL